jgi:hypothetical protein
VAEDGITVPVQLRSTTISDPVTELVDEGWRAERLHGRARACAPLPALKAAAGLLRSRGRSAQDAPAVSGAGRSR